MAVHGGAGATGQPHLFQGQGRGRLTSRRRVNSTFYPAETGGQGQEDEVNEGSDYIK